MYFTDTQVRQVLTYQSLIPTLRHALIQYSAGTVIQPLRTMVPARDNARYGIMSAVHGHVMGTKMVSIYPQNAALGLPSHASIIQLFDADTGQPLATMEADVITEMRTAAVSALAAEILAPQNAKTLCILGAGVQARAHLVAFRHVRDFDRVYIWNRNRATAENFASQTGAVAAESVEDAVSKADVIVAATGATSAILPGGFLKPASLVVAVGAVHPKSRELDDVVMQGALVVDSREAARAESGDVILSGATIYAELGELLAGRLPLPCSARKIFKSVGIAVEDVAAAHLAYELLRPRRTPSASASSAPRSR